MFAKAYFGFPVELPGVDDLHAAFFMKAAHAAVGGAQCRKSGYMGRKIWVIRSGRWMACYDKHSTDSNLAFRTNEFRRQNPSPITHFLNGTIVRPSHTLRPTI
jgi:hypothetical protein